MQSRGVDILTKMKTISKMRMTNLNFKYINYGGIAQIFHKKWK